jgi:hypothetical protein
MVQKNILGARLLVVLEPLHGGGEVVLCGIERLAAEHDGEGCLLSQELHVFGRGFCGGKASKAGPRRKSRVSWEFSPGRKHMH